MPVHRQGLKRKTGNKNAVRHHRKVELDWVNKTPYGYKQVRASYGGGTRNLTVDRQMKMSELLDVALDTFFPDGTSKLGEKNDFKFELRDFKGECIATHLTVQEVYEQSKLKTLRFHLYSDFKVEPPPLTIVNVNPETAVVAQPDIAVGVQPDIAEGVQPEAKPVDDPMRQATLPSFLRSAFSTPS